MKYWLNTLYILFAVFTTVAMYSCDDKTVYNKYNHTPIAGWEKNDTLMFDIPPLPQSGNYQEAVGLRVNDAYPFMSLCLIVEQKTYPSNNIQVDTINCNIIDKDGYTKGSGISYYQYNFDLKQVNINKGDSLHVCIRHNMKREILPGISDIGFAIRQK